MDIHGPMNIWQHGYPYAGVDFNHDIPAPSVLACGYTCQNPRMAIHMNIYVDIHVHLWIYMCMHRCP